MNLPDEFIAEGKRLFPDRPHLHYLLDMGALELRPTLEAERGHLVTQEVADALHFGSAMREALDEKINRLLAIDALYDWWCRLYGAWFADRTALGDPGW